MINAPRQLLEPECGAKLKTLYICIHDNLQMQGKVGQVKSNLLIAYDGDGISLDPPSLLYVMVLELRYNHPPYGMKR